MASIKIQFSDFRAVKQAEVCIGGITVMAGPNGSGKSTVSHLINGLVNGINNFKQNIMVEVLRSFRRDVMRIRRVSSSDGSYRTLIDILNQNPDFDDLLQQIRTNLDIIEKMLLKMANNGQDSDEEIQRRLSYVLGEGDLFVDSIENRVKEYCDSLFQKYNSQYYDLLAKYKRYNNTDLFDSILENYSPFSGFPSILKMWENDHPVVEDESFRDLLFFRKAIYVNTSPSTTVVGYDLTAQRLKDVVVSDLQASDNDEARLLLKELSMVIGGEIYFDKEYNRSLKFRSKNGVNIYLEDAASGIQSLAVLYRLLYAGLLDSETILVLDEPENHLHPQWLVAFARILIKINKQLGAKILIASHCPDFVSALYHFGKAYQIEDVRFYLTQRVDSELRYVFKDCGYEIADIFESFNIALERIGDYGTMV